MCKHTFQILLMLPHMDFSSLAHHIVVGGKVWSTQDEAARGLIHLDLHIGQLCWSGGVVGIIVPLVKGAEQNSLALPTH